MEWSMERKLLETAGRMIRNDEQRAWILPPSTYRVWIGIPQSKPITKNLEPWSRRHFSEQIGYTHP
jgi:hypothetical protein